MSWELMLCISFSAAMVWPYFLQKNSERDGDVHLWVCLKIGALKSIGFHPLRLRDPLAFRPFCLVFGCIILRSLLPKRNSCSWCGPHRDPTASASSCIFGYPKRTGQVGAGIWCLVVKGCLVRTTISNCNTVVVTGFCLVTSNLATARMKFSFPSS